MLLDSGADTTIVSRSGDTAAALASLQGRCDAFGPVLMARLHAHRTIAPTPFSTLPFKDYWVSTGQMGMDATKLFPVAPGSEEHSIIKDGFMRTMAQYTVCAIERVENGYQHEDFCFALAGIKQTMGEEFKEEFNQRLLFHGTDDVGRIVNADSTGFLPLLVGSGWAYMPGGGISKQDSTGAVYGDGCYFARDASYSHAYASTLPKARRRSSNTQSRQENAASPVKTVDGLGTVSAYRQDVTLHGMPTRADSLHDMLTPSKSLHRSHSDTDSEPEADAETGVREFVSAYRYYI